VQRPALLTPVALSFCFFNVFGVVFYEPIEGVPAWFSIIVFGLIYGFVAFISFICIWFFWRGHNWARWVVLVTAVVAVLNLGFLPSSNQVQQLFLVLEALLGVWLLYWLNTAELKRFFKPVSAPR
jgi:hypothetical protein